MLILLTVCHTFHIFYSSTTDFQNFPGPAAFFQDFPVLENATIKFQDFASFPVLVRTLSIGKIFVYNIVLVIQMFKTLKKEYFVSPANSSQVVILISIGDVTDIFAMQDEISRVWSVDKVIIITIIKPQA